MKRISILFLLLMAFVAACGTTAASPSATESEPDPTVAATATAEPTDSAEPGSSGGTAFEGDLADVIPDELNGVPRTDIPGMDSMMASIFAGQGLDASQAQFAFATYGEGTDAVTLTAMAVPGLNDATLELISRSFSGVQGAGEAETLTIDGKSVLKVSGGSQPGVVYMYFEGGAAFTVISENEGLAEQLLSELP